VLPTIDLRGFSDTGATITERVRLNDTEQWDIINTTVDAHPMHLHLVAFQVINRQAFNPLTFVPAVTNMLTNTFTQASYTAVGAAIPPSAWEAGWKDTIDCPPGYVTRVKAKFDIAGDRYVYHCHILSHEEHDMMRPLAVFADGVCGTDNGLTLTTAPTNLCNLGTPSVVAGTGPWTWTCAGLFGGATSGPCSAAIRTYTAVASAAGNGSGSVASSVGGIAYAYPAFATGTSTAINHGSALVLTATAGTGSTVSWTTCTGGVIGGTSAAATCTYAAMGGNMTAGQAVATFTLNQYTVVAKAVGNGTGLVASSPGGIAYGYPAVSTGTSSLINHGTLVTLTATAGVGSTVSWTTCTGGVTGGTSAAATCTYTALPGNVTTGQAVATFALKQFTVVANAAGNGTGTVASSPGGIAYAFPATSTATSSAINYGTLVTLTATAGTGSTVSWTGCTGGVSSGGGTAIATCRYAALGANVTAGQAVATFTLKQYTIVAEAVGNGTGAIASSSGGISFAYPATDSRTSAAINHGTSVTLTATAGAGSTAAWTSCTGGVSAGNGTTSATCTYAALGGNVTLGQAEAAFTLKQYTVVANAAGNGTGTVASSPGGISYAYPTLSSQTSSALNHGTPVTLTATAGTGSTVSWTSCTGVSAGSGTASATCTYAALGGNVTSGQAVATFSLKQYTVVANATGNSTGTVASSLGGISFSYPTTTTATSSAINQGLSVTLTATAGTGSTVSWTSCTGVSSGNGTASATCTYASLGGNVTSGQAVANFALRQYTVVANAAGNGSGTVASSPGGISYSYPAANTGTSSAIDTGALVTLTATAGTGSKVSWTSCTGVSAGGGTASATCTYAALGGNVTSGQAVATFTLDQYTVVANAAGNGSGTVVSSPGTISFAYPTASTGTSTAINHGTLVTLTATAGKGSTAAWTTCSGVSSGSGSSTATCTYAALGGNVTSGQAVATFTLQQYTVVANATGSGTGTVVSSPGGISYSYPTASTGTTSAINYGTPVTLTAVAGPGWTVFWTTCTGVSAGNGTASATCTYAALGGNVTSGQAVATFGSPSVVLWSNSARGQAIRWNLDPTSAAEVGWAWLSNPAGIGEGWQASGYVRAATTDYVLWTHSGTGRATRWTIDPATAARTGWVWISPPSGIGEGWQASSYVLGAATTDYVVWTNSRTGVATRWKVDRTTGAYLGWDWLSSPAGVGTGWQARGYVRVDATTDYVLWTNSRTGQATRWKVDPTSGAKTGWDWISSPTGNGEGWLASDYARGATTDYVIWTNSRTGQASRWKVNPATGSLIGWDWISSSAGVGEGWAATDYYASEGSGAIPIPDAPLADKAAGILVLKVGGGTGTIETSTDSCGPDCDQLLLPTVAGLASLAAIPEDGSVFVGWENAAGQAVDILSILPGESVLAVFDLK
jgi:hypothetical protein